MKRFKEDYELVPTKDERGREKLKAVYRGNYFELSLDEHGLLLFKRYGLLLVGAIAVLHITAGFLNNLGMYQFYIALPYAAIFLPLFYLGGGVLRLPKEKRKYRRDEVELSVGHMKTASKALLVLFAIVVVGEIAFILFAANQGNLMQELLFLAAEMFCALAVYMIVRLHQRILVAPSQDDPVGEQLP